MATNRPNYDDEGFDHHDFVDVSHSSPESHGVTSMSSGTPSPTDDGKSPRIAHGEAASYLNPSDTTLGNHQTYYDEHDAFEGKNRDLHTGSDEFLVTNAAGAGKSDGYQDLGEY